MSEQSLSDRVDKVIISIGNAASWFALVLVVIVCTSVFLRYVMSVSSLGFDELQWHIYSACFLLGFSYSTALGTHVRNDLLYNRFPEKVRLWIDLASYALLLLPFCLIAVYHSVPFAHWAWVQNEGSIDPGGLPHRWIIKSALPICFTLLAISALSRIWAAVLQIRHSHGASS